MPVVSNDSMKWPKKNKTKSARCLHTDLCAASRSQNVSVWSRLTWPGIISHLSLNEKFKHERTGQHTPTHWCRLFDNRREIIDKAGVLWHHRLLGQPSPPEQMVMWCMWRSRRSVCECFACVRRGHNSRRWCDTDGALDDAVSPRGPTTELVLHLDLLLPFSAQWVIAR